MLLLDEPFGALDAKVRDELRTWLRRLHDEVHVTSLFVTHDQQEAFEVADQVVVLNRGKIEQMGPPQELVRAAGDARSSPSSWARSTSCRRRRASGLAVTRRRHPGADPVDGHDVPISVYVRPHDLDLTHERNGRPSWPGRVAV